jgi:quinoprotein glucose dehydrogenase
LNMTFLSKLAAAGLSLLAATSLCPGRDVDWPAYGGDKAGTRYSRLKQINTENVGKLAVAWQYDTGEGRGDAQTEPIVIDGVLYGITPKHRVIALNAATGALLWNFDSGLAGRGPSRGLAYWSNGSERRIFVGILSFLYALDPATGRPVESFGKAGRIDLREGLGRDPAAVSIILTTPGIIYKDLIIVGGRMPETLPSAPGDVRAFSVRTGELRWSFHTVPRPGDEGYDSWPKDAWTYTGSANNWCGMALDEKTGVVYVPTGSAASDFYGYDRIGDNLFANTLLALDAATGKRIWHFQGVHHDIWDRDFPSPPTLLSVRSGRATIPAVAQTTKQGTVYLFDRRNGHPLFPVESKPFPPSNVPGEKSAPSQPVQTKPAPFARQSLTADMLTTRTPEAHAWALERFRTMRSEGQFIPPSIDKETIVFPGYDGGAEWGGSAFDPKSRILYVNSNDIAWTAKLAKSIAPNSGRQIYLQNCAVCHRDTRAGAPPQIPSLIDIGKKRTEAEISTIVRQGAGRMPGFPTLKAAELSALMEFLLKGEDKELSSGETTTQAARYRFTGYTKFLDPDGYPAVAPPWGTLNAIDLNTGEYVWKLPLGEYPELSSAGLNSTGTENYGGPVVTRGGLVFIAATNFDNKMRAFDKTNGKLLWETRLPASGNATPSTYQVSGRQFVVVYATGGKAAPASTAGGVYVAFALPK